MANKSEIRQICDNAITSCGGKIGWEVYNDRNTKVRRIKYIGVLRTDKPVSPRDHYIQDMAVEAMQEHLDKQSKYKIKVGAYGRYSVTFHVLAGEKR